jgi:hypothetical protein
MNGGHGERGGERGHVPRRRIVPIAAVSSEQT